MIAHPSGRPTWVSIQYLRALAALLVVLHHARNPEPWLFNPLKGFSHGQAGVDIFFVISGFIMYAAAREESAMQFVHRRVIRVAPLYWIATGVSLAFFYRRQLLGLDATLLTKLGASLLFVPHYNLLHPTEIWPVLVPGWTLNYEMFFYAVFALALLSRKLVPVVIGVIGVSVAAGLLVRLPDPLWLTYTDPILLDFAFGLLIARFYPAQASRWLVLLMPLGAALLLLTPVPGIWRALTWGGPSALIVMGALALEAGGSLPRVAGLKAIGDASYSIYLVHPMVITVVAKVVEKLPVGGLTQFILLLVTAFGGSILAGLATHRWVERPLLRRLHGRRRTASGAGVAPPLERTT
ncbi:acyltransferase [Sphingomonas yunnanensis]|uniref:acyltransferase family protein n=1 Tax=Sphingomonas yunnanensis TaxID=310400 RepID=UPI001CA6568D|nr:acyltransferase [Sphingomonas yunnanensis]MBY9062824.1 acyltransferase [Sphingomonas yunnanensis]